MRRRWNPCMVHVKYLTHFIHFARSKCSYWFAGYTKVHVGRLGLPGSLMRSQALSASRSQTQSMCGLMQRRLLTPEVHHNEEDGAHSLPRGDSVLTTAHIPIHNLLHSPTVLALRCRDQRLAKTDFDFRPCWWLGSPSTWCLTKGQRYPVHWELLLPPRGWWWKGGPFSYVTKATSGSAVRCCVVPGHQGGAT